MLMHGDAAFAGQGVVAETLNLSQIKGYRVGGTIHVIVNNQLGFTTPPESARSSEYCTDVAKSVQAPILHVNGDDPEACVRVARLAFAYRQRFHKDVVIDMVCYRRHGHNEGDDPSYTQPQMYRTIEQLRSVRKLFVESLVRRGDISMDEAEQALSDFQARLQQALDETRQAKPDEEFQAAPHPPSPGVLPHTPTGVDESELRRVYDALSSTPDGFRVHPKLARQFDARDAMFAEGQVDWALAEALAFGSLLTEGTSVRLAGQDTRRGTFSHRHSTLFDYDNGTEFVPLAQLAQPPHTKLWIYDSLLSEYAALGFEYGYTVKNPDALVMWEAQFGDFANGAQIIIDQYIVAAEDKWDQQSGLVMLLPHGYEGQGPEHSSARLERFLTLSRRGQHPGVPAHDRCAVLPPAAAPGPPQHPQAADRDHPEVGPARQAVALQRRVAHPRVLRGAAHRPLGDDRHRGGHPARARLRQGGPGSPHDARRAAAWTSRSSASSSSTRGPTTPSPRSCRGSPTSARSCGSRRSRRTWVPGTP